MAYAVEKALAIVRAELAHGPERIDPARAVRLAELDEELEALRRVAARAGRAGQIGPLLAELEAERAALAAPASGGIGAEIDADSLRPVIERRLLAIGAALAGAPVERRAAFRGLLGDRRMRVLPDAERRFRVEGLFELALETADARAYDGAGRLH